jgi:hypothetical protein
VPLVIPKDRTWQYIRPLSADIRAEDIKFRSNNPSSSEISVSCNPAAEKQGKNRLHKTDCIFQKTMLLSRNYFFDPLPCRPGANAPEMPNLILASLKPSGAPICLPGTQSMKKERR